MKQAWAWLTFPIRAVERSFFLKMLISFLAIIIVTVCSLGMNFYAVTSNGIKRDAVANMQKLTDQAVLTIESQMETIRNESWNLFGDSELQSLVKNGFSSPDATSYFASKMGILERNNPMIGAILITDMDAEGRIQTGVSNYYGNDEQRVGFEQEIARLRQVAISRNGTGTWEFSRLINRTENRVMPTFVFVQALKDVQKDFQPIIGTIVILLDGEMLQRWMDSLQAQNSFAYTVMDGQDGCPVLRTREGSSSCASPIEIAQMSRSEEKPYAYTDESGRRSLVVYRTISQTEWVLVGKAPLSELLGQVNAVAERTLLIGSLCLIVAMLLAAILSSKVLRPIKHLRLGMKQIEKGNYKIAVPVETKDEIGFFCHSFNRMVSETDSLIRQVYESELKKKDAEIKALQLQMNPHFLYNTLGTIESLASIPGSERMISDICRSISSMLRYNINGGRYAAIEEEMKQIRQYLSIQKIRFGRRLDYELNVDPKLSSVSIPKLLFQPIVENSIIHGIEGLRRGGMVCIEAIALNKHEFQIRVSDNGIGIEPMKLQSIQKGLNEQVLSASSGQTATSIGIRNIHSRIRLLYGDEYGLSIESSQQSGTIVTLTLKTVIPNEEEARDELQSASVG
ncbi:sensor histidine kinase [Paenibacillus rhizovicinus]|uniref:Sensor histidine kinase n=1 Tax=Paenibacillus rhizovicinus TaxID=2704463 RepID=A0A6C0P5E3_9BACL|nr:sensor histidine kinase [Paenibacillus rhizovicinus]QHW33738.1 sensor histidine kinase [Paenibacillus rhizovicinus]